MNIEEPKASSHLLSDELKYAIVFYHRQGLSNKAIAKMVGKEHQRPTLSHQTVKSVLTKYSENKNVDNNWSHEGRPRLINEEMEEEVVNYCLSNRFEPVKNYKEELNLDCSRVTINRVLLDKGLKAYKAPQKVILTTDNVKNRSLFAKEHREWDEVDWQRYIFTDESSFPLVNSNGRIFVRRRPDEAMQQDTVQPFSAYSRTILVWGAISAEGIGPLVRIQGTLDSETYLHIIRYRLKKYYPGLFTKDLVWQEDNARPHKAKIVQDWFEARDIEVPYWPAQSPDLNIIEDVWNKIKFKLKGKVFDSDDELWDEILQHWNAITPEEVLKLYESIPRRIEAVVRAKGLHTKY